MLQLPGATRMPIYRELTGSTGSDSNYRECRVLGSKIAALLAFKIARPAGLVPCDFRGSAFLTYSLLKSCDTRQAVSSLDAWLLSKLCVTDFWCHRAPGPQGYGARLRHGTREDLVSCQSAAVAAAKLCVSQRSTSS